MSETLTRVPVIILGAPRSGTNLLRDLLAAHPLAAAWPCDEINPVWRHGNRSYPNDELPPEAADERVRRFVRTRFERIAPGGATHVIEKTCANCLRVPFVDAIVPEARYVHIVRDGRDAVLSIMARWRGSVEPGYLLRKARYVPPTDVPYYAWRFLRSRLARLVRSDRSVSSWGPRFEGMDTMARERPLNRVCAEQWRRCVRRASDALEQIEADRAVRVRYESLVAAPETEMARLGEFLGLRRTEEEWAAATAHVWRDSVERWRTARDTVADIVPVIRSELERLGYPVE